jgi:hypothetical protein
VVIGFWGFPLLVLARRDGTNDQQQEWARMGLWVGMTIGRWTVPPIFIFLVKLFFFFTKSKLKMISTSF